MLKIFGKRFRIFWQKFAKNRYFSFFFSLLFIDFCSDSDEILSELRRYFRKCWNFMNFLNFQAKIPEFSKNFDRTLIWKVRVVRSLADRTFQLSLRGPFPLRSSVASAGRLPAWRTSHNGFPGWLSMRTFLDNGSERLSFRGVSWQRSRKTWALRQCNLQYNSGTWQRRGGRNLTKMHDCGVSLAKCPCAG